MYIYKWFYSTAIKNLSTSNTFNPVLTMVFFSTRLAVCVVWLGQGYWMIRHIRNVIITSFSLCLYGCGYNLLTEDSLINTLTLHVLMIVLDPPTEIIWGTILDTYLACQGLTIPGEVTLGYHHCLGKLLHLNLLHSSVVVCGPDGERCWMSQGPCHAEGERLGLGQLGLSVLSVHVLDSICHTASL